MSLEYSSIIEDAIACNDPAERLARIACFSISTITMAEKSTAKPFNPILGETFEIVNDNFEMISEQVSHHPPISALYCKGKKKNYKVYCNNQTTMKFSGKCLDVTQHFKTYVELGDHGDKYEFKPPVVSAHNLIVGTMYMDIGGESVIKNCSESNLYCTLNYHKRQWLTKNPCQVDGDVCRQQGKKIVKLYKIQGYWNTQVFIYKYDSSQKVIEAS